MRHKAPLQRIKQFTFNSFKLPSAELSWNTDNLPYSTLYDDIYYSSSGAIKESQHVFIAGNDLPERWKEQPYFSMAELGFGAGLNFLNTWRSWDQHKKIDRIEHPRFLSYIAFEAYPLSSEQLERVHTNWESFGEKARLLRSRLPQPIRGVHRILFPGEQLALTLVYGDALEYLEQLRFKADAWLLDGFSPGQSGSETDSLWSKEILKLVGERTRLGGTFATYTVARAVRERLLEAGFELERRPGFGQKKEMLCGRKTRAEPFEVPQKAHPQRVKIIGAGLAGLALALSLIERGVHVRLVDQRQAPALAASSIKGAALHPHLSSQVDLLMRFSLAGYLHSISLLNSPQFRAQFHKTGVTQLLHSLRLENVAQAVSRLGLEEIAKLETDSIHFPAAGWCNLNQLATALFEQLKPGIEWSPNTKQDKIDYDPETIQVIACGHESNDLLNRGLFSLESLRGQVDFIKLDVGQFPHKVLCGDGYFVPMTETEGLIGSTFERNSTNCGFSQQSSKDLFIKLSNLMPNLKIGQEMLSPGQVAFRAMPGDRLPLIGEIPDLNLFTEAYLPGFDYYPQFPMLKQLYMNTGHGARGLTSFFIAAEILSSVILDEPPAIEPDLAAALHPARFLARKIKRGTSKD
jgi:tRNA 5-methylaminomethyl-2-thiouridine biosynthesis bifunctional protein